MPRSIGQFTGRLPKMSSNATRSGRTLCDFQDLKGSGRFGGSMMRHCGASTKVIAPPHGLVSSIE